jgi:hypothetical protein
VAAAQQQNGKSGKANRAAKASQKPAKAPKLASGRGKQPTAKAAATPRVSGRSR